MRLNSRGQNTLEYAMIIAVVVAALLAINTYIKRGVQGRVKESADQIGRQFDSQKAFTTAWKTKSTGSTITDERRNVGENGSPVAKADGVTISEIRQNPEKIIRSEYESWGDKNQ